jgi:hypothetical protein
VSRNFTHLHLYLNKVSGFYPFLRTHDDIVADGDVLARFQGCHRQLETRVGISNSARSAIVKRTIRRRFSPPWTTLIRMVARWSHMRVVAIPAEGAKTADLVRPSRSMPLSAMVPTVPRQGGLHLRLRGSDARVDSQPRSE